MQIIRERLLPGEEDLLADLKVLVGHLIEKENSVPVIAIDPQGDIASLAELADEGVAKQKGVDPKVRQEFSENVEVVVWTPGSSKGMPICINPLQFDGVEELNAEDKIRYFSATAKNIVNLIGYELDSDDGKSSEAVLSTLFEYCFNSNILLNSFKDVIQLINDLPGPVEEVVGTVATGKLMRTLHKKLSLLNLGARKLIFHTGVPASIDTLLGLDEADYQKFLSRTTHLLHYLPTSGISFTKKIRVHLEALKAQGWRYFYLRFFSNLAFEDFSRLDLPTKEAVMQALFYRPLSDYQQFSYSIYGSGYQDADATGSSATPVTMRS